MAGTKRLTRADWEALRAETLERIETERETARRWAVRLEGELARSQERFRSLEILLERADADRDTALGRLATAAYEASAFRAQRDDVIAALSELLADVIEDLETLSVPARKARQLVERYRRPAPATIETP